MLLGSARIKLNPSFNGHLSLLSLALAFTIHNEVYLHYPNDIDRSLNEAAADKIRKYRSDYNNNPPSSVAFMSTIPSTSGRLHSDYVSLLFLQGYRETDLFFTVSGVQLVESTSDQFHYKRVAFSS